MKRQLSHKQLEANRRNALKSTGPRTILGRTVSSQNALKHGLRADEIAISTGSNPEDPQALQTLMDSLNEQFLPVGTLEEFLVERIATCIWRLRRACRAERMETMRCNKQTEPQEQRGMRIIEVIKTYDEDHTPPPDTEYVPMRKYQDVCLELEDTKEELGRLESQVISAASAPIFPSRERMYTILRYENTIERQLYRALAQLERLQRSRRPSISNSLPTPAHTAWTDDEQ